MPAVNQQDWDLFINKYPNAHLLQKSMWGSFKELYGWHAKYVISGEAGAQVLFRRLPLGFSVAYIPKGPVGLVNDGLLNEIELLSRQENAIVLYIEPDEWQDCESCQYLVDYGYSASETSIQPRQTIVISLKGDEDNWLKGMKQKTRYNIRLAAKKDVHIEVSDDLTAFTDLMEITGNRDEFGIHDSQYYRDVYGKFAPSGDCVLLLAKYNTLVLAGIMLFKSGNRAWYFYGASNNEERNRMPTYLLQWEGMKWAADHGCLEYDLWGIPNASEDTLETQFTDRSDGLWGVYRFKRGFGGEIKRSAGVFQKVLNKPLFLAYSAAMKFRKSILS